MTTRLHHGLLLALALALVPSAALAKKPTTPKKPKPGAAGATAAPAPTDAAAGTTPGATPTPKTGAKASGPVEVTVVQVAGGKAFVKPGAKAGIFRGAKVTFKGKDYAVGLSTDSFAVIDLDDDAALKEDEKGKATLVDEVEDKPAELPKPTPLATFQGGWSPVTAPADTQTPKFVPIGNMETDRRYDVRISAIAGGLVPLGSRGIAETYAELDARVHAEPFHAPVAFDADVALQDWFASNLDQRAGGDSRPLVRVRELLASYHGAGFFGSIGRMRYAASTLGTLDGIRAGVPLGAGFGLAAFGGVLPNPLSSDPAVDAQRFGVEATYSRPDLDLRPEAALVAHGSTFQGKLDERRVSGTLGLYPGASRLGGHFEVSSFAADNPWGAPSVALTAAGLDASVRAGAFSFGGRFDMRQPERSMWLMNYLPLSWFCRTRPSSNVAGAPDVCDGSVGTRTFGEVDAGLSFEHFSLMLAGTATGDLTQADGAAKMVGGMGAARVLKIARILRIEGTGNYSQGTYMKMAGGTLGPGLSLLGDRLDVTAYYRATMLQYRVDSSSLLQNGIGLGAMFFPSQVLVFALQSELTTGDDVKALTLYGTATWRPRL